MNKTTFLCAAGLCLAATASAQKNMEAFRHLAIGVEAGLMGTGVELAMPVQSHLVFKVGYNFFPINYSTDIDLDMNVLNNAVQDLRSYNYNGYSPFATLQNFNSECTVDAKAKLGLDNFKVMLEYYPKKNSTFHFIAGLYIGDQDLISVDGYTDESTWTTMKSNLKKMNDAVNSENLANYPTLRQTIEQQIQNGFPVQVVNGAYEYSLGYDLDGTYYKIAEKDNKGYAQFTTEVQRIKPYLGLGWGRSVPNRRVGFQFEVGCWYHGKPKITSPNGDIEETLSESSDMGDIVKNVKSIQVWPQISLRLIGRLF